MIVYEILRCSSGGTTINLANQAVTEFVHESVHKTPKSDTISGVSFFIYSYFLPHLTH